MAKKVVASLQNKVDSRAFSKVIKMVKSSKTGAYIFEENIVPNDQLANFLKK